MELRSLLGLCDAFRCFVPNFASAAAPLNEKQQKGQQQTFNGLSYEKVTAPETIKETLIEPLAMELPG